MKKVHRLLLLATVAILMAGCYDDDDAWDALDTQQKRIEALEEWQKATASNIEALQAMADEKELITAITPVMHGEVTVGYTITFTTHAPVTIYHGATGATGPQGETGPKGETGATPQIGITRNNDDGNWYWTLNGNLMTDANGELLRANPTDGTDGPDGIPGTPGENGTQGPAGPTGPAAPTPQVKTGQQLTDANVSPTQCRPTPPAKWTTDAIYLSTDGGTTWTQVSGPQGQNGYSSVFSNVDTNTDPNCVIFTLADDTKLNVPRKLDIKLNLLFYPTGAPSEQPVSINSETLLVFPATTPPGTSKRITYTIDSKVDENKIRVSAFIRKEYGKTEWKATTDHKKKEILITPTTKAGERDVLQITATDNRGHSCTYQFILKRCFDGRDGSDADNAYIISTAQELEMVAKTSKEANGYEGKYFRMDNDIHLKGKEWTPIGEFTGPDSTPFKGNFDGGYHCIRGLKANRSMRSAGLFGYVNGCTFENITLIDHEVKTAEENCGALVGFCLNATIKNCYVQGGSCTGVSQVGGLAGYVSGATISNCHVKGTVVTATDPDAISSNAGGLVGGITPREITDCSASGCIVTAVAPGCGGLLGTIYNDISLKACYATGTITSNGKAAGGLIGEAQSTISITMTGCYSGCTITNGQFVNSTLIGFATNNGIPSVLTYTSCYYITDQVDLPSVAGVTWQPEINKEMIEAMNSAIGDSKDHYAPNGRLLSEEWKE